MSTAVAEMPEPEDRAPKLLDRGRYGTNEGMKAEDTKTYTVEDQFRLSWFQRGLRERGMYKEVRSCINDGELNEDLAGMVSQYMSYLMLQEHNIALDSNEVIDQRFTINANFGKDVADVTYKVVV